MHNLPPLFKTVQNYFGPTPPSSKLCKTIMVQPPLFKTVQNYFGPKGKARTHGPRAPSVQKAKLGYSDCLWSVFEFCTLSGEGIGYSDCLWSVFEFCTLSGGGYSLRIAKLCKTILVPLPPLQNCAKLLWSNPPSSKLCKTISVLKAKLGHTDHVRHRFKRRS